MHLVMAFRRNKVSVHAECSVWEGAVGYGKDWLPHQWGIDKKLFIKKKKAIW